MDKDPAWIADIKAALVPLEEKIAAQDAELVAMSEKVAVLHQAIYGVAPGTVQTLNDEPAV